MLVEVADGLGPIPGGRGLGQQLCYQACNQKAGRRVWGLSHVSQERSVPVPTVFLLSGLVVVSYCVANQTRKKWTQQEERISASRRHG